MPLPNPGAKEDQDKFMERCMGDETMNTDFPKQDQRAAVCHSQWTKRENK